MVVATYWSDNDDDVALPILSPDRVVFLGAALLTWAFAALTAWCLGVVVLRVVGR